MESMADNAVTQLLESRKWEKRTFTEIRKRIGGFEDDELRKVLVRCGAIRFGDEGEAELWGLISRNKSGLSAK
jgi:hypothetical protein